MTAFAALAILAACGLLPAIGAGLADMRRVMGHPEPPPPSEADGHFAALQREFDRLQGVMHADGFLPDRRKESRNE